jgi:hypothetical protein
MTAPPEKWKKKNGKWVVQAKPYPLFHISYFTFLF